MLTQILLDLYERDLAKLKSEIEQYTDAADLWRVECDIANSAGNLTLHLVGNLEHFIGAVLGDSGYIRDRDREFSDKGTPREDIVAAIDETRAIVKSTLETLTDEDLTKNYSIEVFGEPMTTGYFLVHLATHLNYHLGQINYHRRLLSKQLQGETIPS
ncbi:hypothetical protein BH20ACI2_BH20ACI2_06130 [soil metagenome]